jgi:hypothetical protein
MWREDHLWDSNVLQRVNGFNFVLLEIIGATFTGTATVCQNNIKFHFHVAS